MFLEFVNFLINGHLPQGEVHQAWIPLAIAAGGMAYGAYQGHQQQKAAERKDRMNAELSALDTAYSPFVASQGYKATSTDGGPGAIGGAIKGGLSGYQTGSGIQQGMNQQSGYEQLLNDMRNQRAGQVAQGGMGYGQRQGMSSGYSSMMNSGYNPYQG